MTIITSLLLLVLGLSPSIGTEQEQTKQKNVDDKRNKSITTKK
jgi:hypothetical protein